MLKGSPSSSSSLSQTIRDQEDMGSLFSEEIFYNKKKHCNDWLGFHILAETCCKIREEEKMGRCLLSLLSDHKVSPKKPRSPNHENINIQKMNVVACDSSSAQENTRVDDDQCLRRKRKTCDDHHKDSEAKKKNKKKRKYMIKMKMELNPYFPQEYMRLTNGAKVELVLQKQLFTSDVNDDLNRLTLPPKQILCKGSSLLRPHELETLENPDIGFITVPIIDTKLEKEEISLSFWKLSSSGDKTLVLKTNWNYIRTKNGLNAGDLIQIWSLRDCDDRLQLALVVVKRAEKCENGTIGSSVSNISKENVSTSHIGRKCVTIRIKCSGSKSESTSASDLTSQ